MSTEVFDLVKHMAKTSVNKELIQSSKKIIELFSSIQSQSSYQLSTSENNDFSPPRADVKFFKVEKLAYDKDYPRREAFANILATMNSTAFNFAYVLAGSEKGIELYVGIVKNANDEKNDFGESIQAKDYGGILKNAFEGNFNGSKLTPIRNNIEQLFLNGAELYKNTNNEINAGLLLGVPTVNKKNANNDQDFQGIDRLINSMLGVNWRIIVVCEPVKREEILSLQKSAYELFNKLSVISKLNIQSSYSNGDSLSAGKNYSTGQGRTFGYTEGDSSTEGENDDGYSSSETHHKDFSDQTNFNESQGHHLDFQLNSSSSKAVTIEIANKHAMEIMKYIDEELQERIRIGLCRGLFKTSVYYMAQQPTHAERLRSCLLSIFQGNNPTYSPLMVKKLEKAYDSSCQFLQTFQNHYQKEARITSEAELLLSRPHSDKGSGLCTYLTADEISLIAGLPQTEVPGLPLYEMVDFGLNENSFDGDVIELGNIVQRGRVVQSLKFTLPKDNLSKHTFITGMTGMGKTTTCHRLLAESDIPFMVIEPADPEYRTLIKNERFKDKPVIVFTLGNETVAPFRLNPFEIIKGELISSHIAMVKASFVSAFDMEASMPQLFEEAIYRCYEAKGWNIYTNQNEIYGDKAFDPDVGAFPVLSELIIYLKEVVEEKKFGNRLGAEYQGTLISRISNLTIGAKGAMLNCEHSTDFDYLADNNVILEMKDLMDEEDKALIIGLVLTRLSAIIKIKHENNQLYKHLTLVEEAHQLLSKTMPNDSRAKHSAVATFTNLLAEIRKYGEGLIIVDQIPNKLAPEVLKNTNTKIIHKISTQDDKDAVGDTMMMDTRQKEYLSALERGHAIIFNEQTNKPVHVCIKKITDTAEATIKDDEVKGQFNNYKDKLGPCYDDLMILPIYQLYNKITKILTKDKDYSNFQALFKKLNSEVRRLSEENSLEKKEIWGRLVRKGDITNGHSSSIENKKERIDYLIEFFSNRFEQGIHTRNEINDTIGNLIIYLS